MTVSFTFYRLLTDIEIKNEDDARRAMQKLHDMGAKTVVITSTELGNEDVLIGFGSTVNSMYQREVSIRK